MKKVMLIAVFCILGIGAASAQSQCTITTDCETVTVDTSSASISASASSQGDGTYLITATSNGQVVYQGTCTSGVVSASCSSVASGDGNDGGGNDDANSSICNFLISVGAPQSIIDRLGCSN